MEESIAFCKPHKVFRSLSSYPSLLRGARILNYHISGGDTAWCAGNFGPLEFPRI